MSLKGKDEMRDIDAFKADTDRMKVEIEAIVEHVISEREKARLEHDLTMRSHDHVYTMIEQTNQADLASKKEPADAA